MKSLGTFEYGDRKPRKSNFDIKIAEGEVLSLTYFSIDEVGLSGLMKPPINPHHFRSIFLKTFNRWNGLPDFIQNLRRVHRVF